MKAKRSSSPIASWRGVSEHGTRYDALVIGGGPAGATTAILLARAGLSVAVAEKSPFPRRKVCGEFISATSLPLLNLLGVAESFLAQAGPPVRWLGLYARDSATVPARAPADGESVWGRALSREHLDLLLLDAAEEAGATLWQPWAARRLRREDEHFVCTLTAKGRAQAIAAPIAVIANGSWEQGRFPLGQAKARKASDLLAFKAHFRDTALPEGLMPLLVFPGGYGGLVASDGGRVTLSCCIRRDALQRCRERAAGPAAEAVFQHILATCAPAREALGDARRDGAWLSAGPIRPGLRNPYRQGLFFVGNSAGEAHPLVAEGISMAMQGAWLLAQRLLSSGGLPLSESARLTMGKAYARDFARAFATRIRAASAFAELATRPKAAALALPAFRRFPDLLRWGARLSGKTTQIVHAP
jgi:flavin-dependent dehydrogenase